jgi:hypothetical protein
VLEVGCVDLVTQIILMKCSFAVVVNFVASLLAVYLIDAVGWKTLLMRGQVVM